VSAEFESLVPTVFEIRWRASTGCGRRPGAPGARRSGDDGAMLTIVAGVDLPHLG
jgi:hypothetical protein